jgi:hypothetical protein
MWIWGKINIKSVIESETIMEMTAHGKLWKTGFPHHPTAFG